MAALERENLWLREQRLKLQQQQHEQMSALPLHDQGRSTLPPQPPSSALERDLNHSLGLQWTQDHDQDDDEGDSFLSADF